MIALFVSLDVPYYNDHQFIKHFVDIAIVFLPFIAVKKKRLLYLALQKL